MRVKGKKRGGGDIDYGYRIRIREQDPLSEQLKKNPENNNIFEAKNSNC